MRDLEIAVSTTNRELESLNKDLLKKINDLENQINRHRDYQQVKEENSILNVQKNDLTQKVQQLTNEKTQMSSQFELLQEKANQCLDYHQIKEQNILLLSEKTELENLSKELRKDLETSLEQLKSFSDYQEVKNRNNSLSEQLSQLETHLHVATEKAQMNESKDIEILSLKESIKDISSKVDSLNEDKARLEREIESSRSIIKDLNKDFEDHQKEIESLKEEKASLVTDLETQRLKIMSDSELNSAKSLSGKTSERLDALANENCKLQEANQELLEKLETLEKSSERKISDLTQEVEELMENSKHYVHMKTEFNELKNNYDRLVKEKAESTEINGNDSSGYEELSLMKVEKDELSNRLKKIMNEVEEVSNKNLFLEQKVENYLILEQSNERLKLTNEKLSRQLDETLVST